MSSISYINILGSKKKNEVYCTMGSHHYNQNRDRLNKNATIIPLTHHQFQALVRKNPIISEWNFQTVQDMSRTGKQVKRTFIDVYYSAESGSVFGLTTDCHDGHPYKTLKIPSDIIPEIMRINPELKQWTIDGIKNAVLNADA